MYVTRRGHSRSLSESRRTIQEWSAEVIPRTFDAEVHITQRHLGAYYLGAYYFGYKKGVGGTFLSFNLIFCNTTLNDIQQSGFQCQGRLVSSCNS